MCIGGRVAGEDACPLCVDLGLGWWVAVHGLAARPSPTGHMVAALEVGDTVKRPGQLALDVAEAPRHNRVPVHQSLDLDGETPDDGQAGAPSQ